MCFTLMLWEKQKHFKDLKLVNYDFTFCIELPVKAKLKSFKMIDFPSLKDLE